MNKPLFIVITTVFVDLLGFGIIIPIQPFLAEDLGASPAQVTGLMTAYALMQFLFAPIWGRLSDRVGRRPVLLGTILWVSLSMFATGMATTLIGLYLARTMAGLGAANLATAQAYVADVTTPETRAKGMGLIGAAFGVGFILGPAMGGLLADPELYAALTGWLTDSFGAGAEGLLPTRYSLPFFVAGALSGVNFLSAMIRLPESLPEEVRAKGATRPRRAPGAALLEAVRKPKVGPVILLFALMVLAWANMEATFALITERTMGYYERENGLLFAWIGVWIAITQGGLIGPMTRRFGEPRLLVVGQAMVAAAFVMIAFTKSLPVLLFAVTVNAVGNGLGSPAYNAIVSRLTSAEDQGLTMGAMQGAGSLARVVGPMWGGWSLQFLGASFLGPGAPLALAAVLMAGCAAAAAALRPALEKQLAEAGVRMSSAAEPDEGESSAIA